jgi:ribonucleotide reductase alpha subunit
MVKKELSIYDELGEERKRLQAEGKLPEWVTTPAWQILKENYLTEKHPDLLSVYTRISTHAASYTPEPELWREKFFNLLWKGWLAASSPVLSNMGTGIGCAVSCSGGYINDSVYDFYDAQKEAAVLSKNGFGTSGYLGAIRPRGSKIAGMKGAASGVLPVFKDFVQLSRDISQGSQRRGAWAGYIEIDHGDFHELVNYIAKNPDDANIGWNITDEFIARLDAGDPDAIERYQKALKLKMITGKGYFFFVDKVNRQAPQMYKDKGLEIKASNLCLTGDTLIKIKIADAVNSIKLEDFVRYYTLNSTVQVQTYLDGNVHWSSVSAAAQTAVVTELYVIVTANSTIRCTGNHKIFTVNRGYVEAKDLTETDYLLDSNGEVASITVDVIEVEETPVYDITVPETECFFANDLLVHNCAEIALFSDADHTFSCVLSSMNLSRYDEWKDTTAVFDSTVFLDCVNQDLIEIGKRTRGMEKITRFAEKSRALGLGVLGFHTYLQDNMIPFASMDAYFKNIEIFKHIDAESKRASEWMAVEFGEPEWCKGYGVRNTHRLTCPPTLTNALIVGSVSQGIEPIYKNAYIQNTAAGKIDRVNPTLLRLMKEKGVYSDETVKDIIANNGSVQHVDWLKDDEKEVFLTAFEIPQTQIIRLASARQKYIDQAQSINLFFSADEDEEYISEVHKMAFKDPYVKSLYYIRSENGVNVNKSECTTCQG